VYNVELASKLCRDIVEAVCDPDREQELLYLLQVVMSENQDQLRIRAALLSTHETAVCYGGT
jgi:hypothetical protein